jgi:hypothetical protein
VDGGESGIRTRVIPLDSVSYRIYVVENARNATQAVDPCTLCTLEPVDAKLSRLASLAPVSDEAPVRPMCLDSSLKTHAQTAWNHNAARHAYRAWRYRRANQPCVRGRKRSDGHCRTCNGSGLTS